MQLSARDHWMIKVAYIGVLACYVYVMWSVTNPHATVYLRHYVKWAQWYIYQWTAPAWSLRPPTGFRKLFH
jgi:hypothetical protein